MALETLNANTPIYNTLMSVVTGVALCLLVALTFRLVRGRPLFLFGWAVAFGVLGAILTFLSAAMVVSWPLPAPVSFDNIIFGEPGLAFGALLLTAAYVLGSRRFWAETTIPVTMEAGSSPGSRDAQLRQRLEVLLQPLAWFVFALGLIQFSIAAAGLDFTLFAAPPSEPISGNFSDSPMIEASFISALYVLTGIGAVLLPFALQQHRKTWLVALWVPIWVAWGIAGVVFVLFGAMNYYTHIGDIVHQNEQAGRHPGRYCQRRYRRTPSRPWGRCSSEASPLIRAWGRAGAGLWARRMLRYDLSWLTRLAREASGVLDVLPPIGTDSRQRVEQQPPPQRHAPTVPVRLAITIVSWPR